MIAKVFMQLAQSQRQSRDGFQCSIYVVQQLPGSSCTRVVGALKACLSRVPWVGSRYFFVSVQTSVYVTDGVICRQLTVVGGGKLYKVVSNTVNWQATAGV